MRKADQIIQVLDDIPDRVIAGSRGQWSRMEKILGETIERLQDKTRQVHRADIMGAGAQ